MRDQLRAFEGQIVIVTGRITERKIQTDGSAAICLNAVEIRPHRTDVPLRDLTPVRVDHLWIRDLEAGALDWRGLLRAMSGAARVTYYRRRDGSVDLGIESVGGVCLENVINAADAEPTNRARNAVIANAADRIKRGELFWSWDSIADKHAAELVANVQRFDAEVAMNLGAILAAPANGPCSKMRAADPFAALRRRKQLVLA